MASRRDSRRTGLWPLAYMGVEPVSPPLLLTDDRAPTSEDRRNFNVGTIWIDRSTAPLEDIWMLVNLDGHVARWLMVTNHYSLRTLTGNIGGAIEPDADRNIDIIGAGPYVITGNPATNTLTLTDNGTIAREYVGDVGSAFPLANVLNVLGGLNINSTGAGNTITVNTDPLAEGSMYVDGAGVYTSLGTALDGEVLIGSTGNPPGWANITSGDGSIIITNGSSTIDLSTTGGIEGIGYLNVGMTVNTGGSTITIHSEDGTAFSATNKGYIQFASKVTPGTFIRLEITANVAMAWGDMDGNTMGTEGALAWADNMPLYVYAVLDAAETACTFGLARVPHHVASGALANIGTPASATADDLLSLFLFASVTIANYDDNPAFCLGAVTATKNGADQWVFLAVKGGTTGVAGFHIGSVFDMPPTQMGADNNYATAAGGTIPIFTSSDMNWGLTKEGYLSVSVALNGIGTIGVGANEMHVALPFAGVGLTNAGIFCVGTASVSAAAIRGVYRAIGNTGALPGGFPGLQFIKNEIRRLQVGDFDTVTGVGSQLTGSIEFAVRFNPLP